MDKNQFIEDLSSDNELLLETLKIAFYKAWRNHYLLRGYPNWLIELKTEIKFRKLIKALKLKTIQQ